MPESQNNDALTWTDNADLHRWEVRRGEEVVAFAEYRISLGRIAFMHTVVDPEFEGQGIGSRLARTVLDDALERDLRITPHCPFIRAYIERHPDRYSGSVDAPDDARQRA